MLCAIIVVLSAFCLTGDKTTLVIENMIKSQTQAEGIIVDAIEIKKVAIEALRRCFDDKLLRLNIICKPNANARLTGMVWGCGIKIAMMKKASVDNINFKYICGISIPLD